MDALISTAGVIVGAAIGALATIVGQLVTILTIHLQTKRVARTERTKLIVQLAIEDLKLALEQARRTTPPGGTSRIAPLVARLDYYEAALNAIELGEGLDSATLQRIRERSREIFEQTSKP